MTDGNDRPARFRAILNGTECVHPATVFDPMSGIMAEELGFKAGIFAGAIASLAILAAPDRVLMTLSEVAEQARRVTRACRIPFLVDGDHGYGNALNVIRTVRELEAVGVAALSIEDTELPQPFGGGAGGFISIEEGAAKMRAALEARTSPDFVIVGRTSAAARLGLDAAIARGRAYEAAGVDALFFPGLGTRDQVEALGAAFEVPLIIGGIAPDAVRREWLAGQGVRLALPGHAAYFAGLKGLYDAMRALREDQSFAGVEQVAPEDVARWSKADDWSGHAAAFLDGGEGSGS
jgi:carboxyvinyl-carboxyphosphonate phosphorylmutase